MSKSQITRLIALIIFWLLLVILPLFNQIYYVIFYYIIAALILLAGLYWIIQEEKVEKRFYKRWDKLRKKGFLFNVIRGTSFSFVFMTVVVCLGQLFGNGQTPAKTVSLVGNKATWIILLLLIVFALIMGIIMWYENEKRYHKIHFYLQE